MNAGFRISVSLMQPGTWQVRVRDLTNGQEDTVDRCYSLLEAQDKFDALSKDMRSLGRRPE